MGGPLCLVEFTQDGVRKIAVFMDGQVERSLLCNSRETFEGE